MWQQIVPADWQTKQRKLGAHFLQSAEWGAFQHAYGHKIFYCIGDGWSWLATVETGKLGSRLYCPYGPTAASPKALAEALQALQACAKSEHLAYVRVEPQGSLDEQSLRSLGLRPAHRTIQPRYTFVKNLTKNDDDLMAEMSATNRNLYRTAGKKGITFRTSTNPADISIFLEMMHEVATKNDITIHADHYYQVMAEVLMPFKALILYIADLEGQPVASSIVLDDTTTRYYAHAASKASARKLHPGTPLVAHMIFDAKAAGKQAFDFYGIAPPDQPNHRWAGFTQFKQSFGGQIVDMHGTWELGINKPIYAAYKLASRLLKG
jgi:lipid II:glycine glycyltransferase (peptidoglycan interpeptide bridge formation enzyme)